MAISKEAQRAICENNLYTKTAEEYGDMYRDHFLEQYKVVIQGVDYTSKWKHIVNNYFLTMNTVFLAAIGLSAARDQLAMPTVTRDLIPIIGILISVAWLMTARGYNDVLEAKFSILHTMEKYLPVSPYKTEWELLCAEHGSPRRLAFIDGVVPFLFLAFYGLILFFVK